MRLPTILMAVLLLAGGAIAGDGSLADRLFTPESNPLDMLKSGLQLPESNGLSSDAGGKFRSVSDMNPGKAMLLSAIVPGAGELYAGKKIKAAVFFAVELAAWATVITYYNKGVDKEDEFIAFADANFDEGAYRQVEFDLARNQAVGDSGAFNGTIDEWTEKDWNYKIHYLPREGFTHELPTQEQRDQNWSDDQQFYEMIGKYIHQFGFGWGDATGDDAGTHYFDGSSPMSLHYMDMRHDSNQLLKTSAWGYNIALLNHLVSALDASLTVRMMNRSAKAEMSFRQVPYGDEIVPAGGVKLSW